MPWASKAQMRLFYARPDLRKYIPEYEAATPNPRALPERVHKKRTRRHGVLRELRKMGDRA